VCSYVCKCIELKSALSKENGLDISGIKLSPDQWLFNQVKDLPAPPGHKELSVDITATAAMFAGGYHTPVFK